jgi:hypothetical protein
LPWARPGGTEARKKNPLNIRVETTQSQGTENFRRAGGSEQGEPGFFIFHLKGSAKKRRRAVLSTALMRYLRHKTGKDIEPQVRGHDEKRRFFIVSRSGLFLYNKLNLLNIGIIYTI